MMPGDKIYDVVIIGCGNIGCFYDSPGTAEILSYAHAFNAAPGFKIKGFVDIELDRARRAAMVWDSNYYTDFREAMDKCQPQVICVAVPDKYHCQLLTQLADYPLDVIIAEKPLATSIEEAMQIKRSYAHSSTAVAVNYTRRFIPEFLHLRNSIKEGHFGLFLSGTGYYGKGLLHNGSHHLDLIRFLLGEICSGEPFAYEHDYYDDDPSISAVLQLQNGRKFVLQSVDCRAYTLFEMDLLFQKKRIRIINAGFEIEEYDVTEDAFFKDYFSLEPGRRVQTSLPQAMFWGVDSIYEYLQEGKALPCTLEDGYQLVGLCENLKRVI